MSALCSHLVASPKRHQENTKKVMTGFINNCKVSGLFCFSYEISSSLLIQYCCIFFGVGIPGHAMKVWVEIVNVLPSAVTVLIIFPWERQSNPQSLQLNCSELGNKAAYALVSSQMGMCVIVRLLLKKMCAQQILCGYLKAT